MTFKKMTYRLLATFLITLYGLSLSMVSARDEKLLYDTPASEWGEALPLGNSKIGAMIFSGPTLERVQINNPDMWGEQDRGHLFSKSMGSVLIEFPGHDRFTGYQRELSLDSALLKSSYKSNGVTYTRETFTPFGDNVMVMKISSSEAGALDFNVRLDTQMEKSRLRFRGNRLVLSVTGEAIAGTKNVIKGAIVVEVVPRGGKLVTLGDSITLQGADEALIYVAATTNLNPKTDRVNGSALRKAQILLGNLVRKPFPELKNEHTSQYNRRYGNIKLDLGETPEVIKTLPTNQRVSVFSSTTDPELAATLFQYGRYLWVSLQDEDEQILPPVTWPMQGEWLVAYLRDRYLFTGDIDFLKGVYPALKSASDFFLSTLSEDEETGTLIMKSKGADVSYDGLAGEIIGSGKMDNEMLRELLAITRQAGMALGDDSAYLDALQYSYDRLPPFRIDDKNQLQDYVYTPEEKYQHISHGYGLYPGSQISPYVTPEIFEAARITMLQRGDEMTGWNPGLKTNLWVRLLDGNKAFNVVNNLISEDLAPNMLTMQPNFSIESNFGYTAGVTEMLLQSHDNAVHLLPALPDVWQKGNVTGLKTRGGFVVDMDWDNGQLNDAVITSELGGNLRLRSYIPLEGIGLMEAKGENPNQMFVKPDETNFQHSKNMKPRHPILKRVYEYDLPTVKGKTYRISRK